MSTVEETLAWEAEQRPRAAAAAALGGILTIAGSALLLTTLSDGPTEDDGFISITESVASRLAGAAPEERSLLAASIVDRQDSALAIWASLVLSSAAVVLAMLALLYLHRATQSRAPETTGNIGRFAAYVAMVVVPVGLFLAEGSLLVASEPANAEEARDIIEGSGRVAGQVLQLPGFFALGLTFVLVALSAMRVGLLTRFMGILGMIVGGLAVIQLDAPQLIRTFWLVALGLLIAGRVRNRPPAWETGRAQPWPSQQQVREARRQAALGTNVPPSEPDAPSPSDDESGDPPLRGVAADAPAPARRKRKKRR